MGFWATLLVIGMCLPAAYAIERRRFPGRSALGALIFVPAIFPTITYGIAIGVYLALYAIQLKGSFFLVILATATWTIPLVTRVIQGSIATTDVVYEEAAIVMGASPIRTFFKITLPLIAPGVITAGAIAFTSAATNFTSSLADGVGRTACRHLHLSGRGRSSALPRKRRFRFW